MLSEQRTGLVMRIHHAMADGISALRIGEDLLWDTYPYAAPPLPEQWHAEAQPSGLRLAANGVAERTADAGRAVANAVGSLTRPRQLLGSLRDAAREPGVLIRELTPLGNSTGGARPSHRTRAASSPSPTRRSTTSSGSSTRSASASAATSPSTT